MLGHRLLRGNLIACIALAAWLSSNSAFADAPIAPSNAELFALIKSLQARVSALEATSAEYKKEAETAQATLNQMANRGEPRASSFQPLLLAAPVPSVAQPRVIMASTEPNAVPQWSGFYWGASFGIGSALSSSAFKNTDEYSTEQHQVRSQTTEQNGTPGSQLELFNTVNDQLTVATGKSDGSDQHVGGLAGSYLGVSFHLAPRILAGIEAEGSLAEMSFDSKIRRTEEINTESSSSTSSQTNSDGFTNESSNSSNSTSTRDNAFAFPDTNQVQLDWTASVIGRAGWLASPNTFVYGLGGWTYGRFELGSADFGNGHISDFGTSAT